MLPAFLAAHYDVDFHVRHRGPANRAMADRGRRYSPSPQSRSSSRCRWSHAVAEFSIGVAVRGLATAPTEMIGNEPGGVDGSAPTTCCRRARGGSWGAWWARRRWGRRRAPR